MRGYVSFVLTAREQSLIRHVERLLKKVGIPSEYSEFRPAIPQLSASYSVTVRTAPGKAEQMRGRITMVLSVISGYESIDVGEFAIQHQGRETLK